MRYTITIKSTGRSFSCGAQETLLDAALRQGIALTAGCRRGICGVCIGVLDSGTICYASNEEPMAFFGEDNQNHQGKRRIVVCEALPKSDLVLDMYEVDSAEGMEQKNLSTQIIQQKPLSSQIQSLTLSLPDDEYLQFLPGQSLLLITDDGHQHAFSPANAPQDSQTLTLHINKEDLRKINKQNLLRVKGPFGDFFLRTDTKRDLVLITEKEGFAAIKSITEHLISRAFENHHIQLYIYWLGETQDDIYLHQLGKNWSEKYTNIHFSSFVTNPVHADTVSELLAHLSRQFDTLAEMDFYISATENTVDLLEFELISKHVKQTHIFYHRFNTKNPGNTIK